MIFPSNLTFAFLAAVFLLCALIYRHYAVRDAKRDAEDGGAYADRPSGNFWTLRVFNTKHSDNVQHEEEFSVSNRDMRHLYDHPANINLQEIEDELAGYAFYTLFSAIEEGIFVDADTVVFARGTPEVSLSHWSDYSFVPDLDENGSLIGVKRA